MGTKGVCLIHNVRLLVFGYTFLLVLNNLRLYVEKPPRIL